MKVTNIYSSGYHLSLCGNKEKETQKPSVSSPYRENLKDIPPELYAAYVKTDNYSDVQKFLENGGKTHYDFCMSSDNVPYQGTMVHDCGKYSKAQQYRFGKKTEIQIKLGDEAPVILKQKGSQPCGQNRSNKDIYWANEDKRVILVENYDENGILCQDMYKDRNYEMPYTIFTTYDEDGCTPLQSTVEFYSDGERYLHVSKFEHGEIIEENIYAENIRPENLIEHKKIEYEKLDSLREFIYDKSSNLEFEEGDDKHERNVYDENGDLVAIEKYPKKGHVPTSIINAKTGDIAEITNFKGTLIVKVHNTEGVNTRQAVFRKRNNNYILMGYEEYKDDKTVQVKVND